MVSLHVKYTYYIIYKATLFHTPPGKVILHAPSSVKCLLFVEDRISVKTSRPIQDDLKK